MLIPRRGRRMRLFGALLLLAPLAVVAPAAPALAADCSAYPWMNRHKSPEQRARALLAASSQHQKYRWLVEQPANTPQQTDWPDGVVYPMQPPCTPTVVYTDGPDGVRFTDGVTLEPGHSRAIEIDLSRSDLADLHLLQYFDAGRGGWVTAHGTYRITVGASSAATRNGTLHVR